MQRPGYITRAGLLELPVSHRWAHLAEEVLSPPSEELQARLRTLSLRAELALLTGAAEWIVYRFEKTLQDKLPLDAIDAAWLQQLDPRYALPYDESFEADEWSGPVRGPIGEAMRRMWEASVLIQDEAEIVDLVAELLALAAHVLPNPAPLRAWQEQVIGRLAAGWPRRAEDPLGDPVPREALDPEARLDPTETEALLREALARVDPEEHPFTASPEELLAEGFPGTPYQFELEADRAARGL